MPKKIVENSHLLERVKEKPRNYPICLYMGCTKRDKCLHALETSQEHLTRPIITCVNPLTYSDKEDCKQFRDKDDKTMYAFGMKNIAYTMKQHDLYKAFKSACMHHFCRTIYYDMMAGQHIIYPVEQKIILDIVAQLGIHLPANSFDQMVEATGW